MICKKCNFENETDARFCENCGASLQESKNPVQSNKGLKKVIMGCIALLYVSVIVCFVVGIVFTDYKRSYYSDPSSRNSLEDALNFWYDALNGVMVTHMLLSVFLIIAIIVLFYAKKINKVFGIFSVLLCIYAAVGTFANDQYWSMIIFFPVFIAAVVTIFVYKYAFAENQKLL
jgi:hypothetical protein